MLRAFWLGLRDGFHDGHRFSCGRSWDAADCNESYDHGVNVGQAVRFLAGVVP